MKRAIAEMRAYYEEEDEIQRVLDRVPYIGDMTFPHDDWRDVPQTYIRRRNVRVQWIPRDMHYYCGYCGMVVDDVRPIRTYSVIAGWNQFGLCHCCFCNYCKLRDLGCDNRF